MLSWEAWPSGPHRMWDYPKRFKLSMINKGGKAEPDESKALKCGSMMLNSAKAKMSHKQKGLILESAIRTALEMLEVRQIDAKLVESLVGLPPMREVGCALDFGG
ncbi:hypothetical protein J1N35_011482 [Gossypium stocksii]|uniref:Uncharacterized protein n=1 Tax=Gossypium stocksii TaxID=47602 RepID=A0A9D4ADB8_9ROSI|nr:hypothetical protein J1N35_011482 [Gossypium stocksii]